MGTKYNMVINQGSTFRHKFLIKNKDMSAVNINDSIVRMQIRKNHHSEVILDLGQAGYIFISDPLNGEVSIEIPASVTKDLDFDFAYYDIELEYSTGYVYRFLSGSVKVSLEITQ